MSSELAASWSRTMAGTEIDVESFVGDVLAALARGSRVEGRLHGATEIELSAGAESTRFEADAASGTFRMVCARLVVLFGGDTLDPRSPYGGPLSAELQHRGKRVGAALEFSNTVGEAWFRLAPSV
jgi:hypothetical protein